ncbi:cell wall-associated hydrolase, invasion-associated protein [Bradyrhizobium sp. YR681]|uniref:NlpC/P60 family protein n=1 Tax=Bradyrhizobium sp. YR681 TaxID=1144344 RepID=UPI000270DED4|nr:NlpC/P60 family protein [Bradyrhizobium sp. YR681]EJN15683.1 cell wall-associated hydrolase, invasion-associated protein [Bradyrhizobium sp. YR681]
MSEFDAFVGIPYADRGRARDGCDCYGLLRLVMAELRGVDLPAFSGAYVTTADRAALAGLIAGEIAPWQPVALGEERAFDGVLLRHGRALSHIGLVVMPGRMLHVSEGGASCIESYRAPPWSHRLAGIFRYRSLLPCS